MYESTTATKRLLDTSKRIRAVAGGTSASKTISILLILIDKAQSDKTPKLTSVVAESTPHLKRGAMRDFLDIMKAHGYYKEENWNRTDSIYTFETGSQIEFFGVDAADKLRGARRDRLFINEANNVTYGAFNELEVRTRDEVWLDWNPTNEFWFYTDLQNSRDDIDFLTVTYKDNEALDQSTVDTIEARKANKQWWRVYGLGLLGEHEARIYKDWQIIDEIPHEARLERYGLDFGYSNDPTALVAVYKYNNGWILHEELYKTGMTNQQIADYLKSIRQALVVADSAEPKSIDEIKLEGITIIPTTKGPGSLNQGIQWVQGERVSVTKQSTNLIKEYRNYMWKEDRDGKLLNAPEPMWDHALDAVRYALTSFQTRRNAPTVYKPKKMMARKYR